MGRFNLDDPIVHSSTIHDYCKPLFAKTGIKTFGYVEFDGRGHFIQLESSAEIYQDILNTNIISTMPCIILTDINHAGYYLDSSSKSSSKGISQLKNKYKLGNGLGFIDIIKSKKTGRHKIRHFYFTGHQDEPQINSLYLNHLDELKNFCFSFYAKFEKLIDQLNKFTTQTKDNEFKELFDNFISSNLTSDQIRLYQSTSYQKSAFDYSQLPFNLSENTILSPIEKEIIYLWYFGFDSKESADILELSPRTIDRHFNKIRAKLNCRNKMEILHRLF